MRQLLWLWMALVMVACATGPQPIGKGTIGTDSAEGIPSTYDGSASTGSSEGVVCPNPLNPKNAKLCTGATPVCCLSGPLGVKPSCVADASSCGGSTFACDDATDCGEGQACCSSQQSGGGSITAQCRNQCTIFQEPLCNGTGTCKGDQICCQDEGDDFGTCVGAKQTCPVDTGS